MIERLKDPAKLSLLITIAFFAGILLSGYMLYTLPQDLMWHQAINVLNMGEARMAFIKPSIVIAITFGIGILAITHAQRSKKEVIVYLDKKKSETNAKGDVVNEDGTTDSAGVASFRSALQGVTGQKETLQHGLNLIASQLEAGQAAIYLVTHDNNRRMLELKTGYALNMGESQTIKFEFGEGLIGQAASSGKNLYIDEVPEGYVKVISGLGNASPRYLFIVNIKNENEVKGVVEIATFSALKESTRKHVEEMVQVLATKIS